VFRKVLVANRGEIALRIMRGCRELGVLPVAVCSEADRDGPWLDEAAETVCIGPARASDSYLDAGAILQAADQTGCQAVHPGYGFLAENAGFAARCEQQGLTFIGPGPSAIRRMGDKAEAKETIARAGLPTIPGSSGILANVEEGLALAMEIGFPVLLKATAGGGGRGMRIATDENSFRKGYSEATLESGKAFGNPGLYLEKFVTGGRHIEFQILCDSFGNGIHLGERECSVQRNHQKLVEESPSPVIPAELRDSFGTKVATAIASLGYRNAGTVEFLRAPGGELYFMELNTRLQVEHPVSEMITGIDIVRQQLLIAAGHRLEHTQSDISFNGHAVELRINAENPKDNFRPDPGTITKFKPPTGKGVRWDSAIREGYRIPPHYDSMVGKLIVHGIDRDAALDGAVQALDSMTVEGVHTTIELQRSILNDPAFRKGEYDVDWLAGSGLLEG
jgi:acetyl-CoA carboxylase biotin carboxylase subunit